MSPFAVFIPRRVYAFWTVLRIRVQRWKYFHFRHDGAYTRTLQQRVARGKGWA